MKLFDMATWTAVVILVLGSSAVFVWFLKDAGKVLKGHGMPPAGPPGEKGEPEG
jgi:hypothetical protein